MAKEENFKVCGLCSRLVDESVQLSINLRAFLVDFLDVANADLPSKVCADCYQGSFNSKKFKEGCDKAIAKLRNTKLSEHMILGRSAEDKKQVEASAPDLPPPTASKQGNKKPPAAARSSTISRELASLTGSLTSSVRSRASRSNGSSPGPAQIRRSASQPGQKTALQAVSKGAPKAQQPGPRQSKAGGRRQDNKILRPPVVTISHVEKKLADQALDSGGTISYGKRKGGLITPSRTGGPPSAKRARNDIDTTPASVSSFGRVRSKSKRGYDYVSIDEITPEENDSPDTPRSARAPPASRGASTPPSRAATSNGRVTPRAGPASRGKGSPARATTPQNKKLGGKKMVDTPKGKKQQSKYYYVDDAGGPPDVIDVDEDENENDEEIFPSIGPYQCEICQVITSTKQEFVDHIKQFHRDVVDEEVLRSLENDLKKSKKKTVGKTQRPGKKELAKQPAGGGKSKTAAAALAARKKQKMESEKKRKMANQQKKRKATNAARAKNVARKSVNKSPAPAKRKNAKSEQNTDPNESSVSAALSMNGTSVEESKEVAEAAAAESTPMDTTETHGLDGEVVEEEEEGGDDSKSQFWKTNVARKYEKETVHDGKIANGSNEAEEDQQNNEAEPQDDKTEPKEDKDALQVTGGETKQQQQDPLPEVRNSYEPTHVEAEQPQVTESFSAFHPVMTDAGWANATVEPLYQAPAMVQTYVPLTSTAFHLQQDGVNAASHYSIMSQQSAMTTVPVTNYQQQQQIFVTEASVEDNGQAGMESGISMPQMFY